VTGYLFFYTDIHSLKNCGEYFYSKSVDSGGNSMLQLLEELDQERKKTNEAKNDAVEMDETERKRQEEKTRRQREEKRRAEEKAREEEQVRHAEIIRNEKERKQREEKRTEEERIREEDQTRQEEIIRMEEKKRLNEEKRREEERLREEEQAREADKIKNEEKKKIEESLKQVEVSKEFQVDEAKFAPLCKKSTGEKIARYLEHNRELLNCLDGRPLREAARAGNIEVVDTLLGASGILVNLQSEHGLTALHFATTIDDAEIVQALLNHDDIQPNIEDK